MCQEFPSPESSASLTEGTQLPIHDQDTMVGVCGESNGTLSSPAGIPGLHSFCGAEPRIVGDTTGITEAGCVTGSPQSWGGEGKGGGLQWGRDTRCLLRIVLKYRCGVHRKI